MSCEICCSSEAKYRCPGCNTRTCSVGCVKAHKVEGGCDGRRCKTAYVSQNEFTDGHLLSDYRLLEEVGCYVDSINRDGVVRGYQKRHGLNLHRFKNACRRRNITFLYQQSLMTKRMQNSTSYNGRRDMISWKVQWVFADADHVCYTDPRVCEDTPLKVLLEKYLHPTNADPIVRHRLQKYLSDGGIDNVEVYMKVEWRQLKGIRYYKMDVTQSLRKNLSHKTVLEYPTLHVCIAQSSVNIQYTVYDQSMDYVFTEPKTRISDDDDDGSSHDDDITIRDGYHHKGQSFSHSATNVDTTNPYPATLGEHCDTSREKDHMIPSSSRTNNALELLMGQYCDSDSELEPGEVL